MFHVRYAGEEMRFWTGDRYYGKIIRQGTGNRDGEVLFEPLTIQHFTGGAQGYSEVFTPAINTSTNNLRPEIQ